MYKEQILLKNNDWGISHWDREYLLKTDGDTKCEMYFGGKNTNYKEFFNLYKLYGFNAAVKVRRGDGYIKPKFINDSKVQIREPYGLLIGKPGTVALPHYHHEWKNFLISGSKRWIFFDSIGNEVIIDEYRKYFNERTDDIKLCTDDPWVGGSRDYRGNFIKDEWLNYEYPKLLQEYKNNGGKIIDFIQKSGDVVNIPKKWVHATICLEECLSLITI